MSKVIKNQSLHNGISSKGRNKINGSNGVSVQFYKLQAIKLASDLRRANHES